LQVIQGQHEQQQTISQVVVFQLNKELYGADIAVVREVVPLQRVTRVPRTPDYVEGVINLRGRVIPVIDLRRRLGLPSGQVTKATRIAVGEVDGDQVGMIVDAVEEVLRVPASAVEPPSSLLAQLDRDNVLGVAKVGDRLITLLDLARILVREERKSAVAP
jgi:purine-binding chemotaxis protein CheW